MQPLTKDADGTVRFKANAIVRFLLDWSSNRGMSLNDLALIPFSADDRQQFAQLIGYSLNGFDELSYVDDVTFEMAANIAEKFEE